MSDQLFSPEAFEQIRGQMSMEQVEMTFGWFRFVPDRGPATSFSADSTKDAQRFAAERFHGQPGAIFRLELDS